MSDSINKLGDTILKAIDTRQEKKPKGYSTQAEVTKVVDNTAWVHIPGGADETPVQKTISCKKGDTVQVRVENGTATITGNNTAPPTDDSKATKAQQSADVTEAKVEEIDKQVSLINITTDKVGNVILQSAENELWLEAYHGNGRSLRIPAYINISETGINLRWTSGGIKFCGLNAFKTFTATGTISLNSGAGGNVSVTGTKPAGFTPIAVQSIESDHNQSVLIGKFELTSTGASISMKNTSGSNYNNMTVTAKILCTSLI